MAALYLKLGLDVRMHLYVLITSGVAKNVEVGKLTPRILVCDAL